MKQFPQPTNEEIEARKVFDADRGQLGYATWHPQWGGYVGKCLVYFDKESGSAEHEAGCYDVVNWHDGEFPTEPDGVTTGYHYCSAEQQVNFGLEVLEKQCEHQIGMNGKPVFVSKSWVERTLTRLQELRTEDESHRGPLPPGWHIDVLPDGAEGMEWQAHGPKRTVFRTPKKGTSRTEVEAVCWRMHEILGGAGRHDS